MKKIFLLLFAITLFSCDNDDDLSNDSVIRDTQKTLNDRNELDKFIETKFTQPYNIELLYRFVEREVTRSWPLVPTKYEKGIEVANVLNYLYIEPYVKVTSKQFMKRYSPNMIVLVGSLAYNPSGTVTRGLAINGVKITLMNINAIKSNDIYYLNNNMLKTMYHETAHVWHQTVEYPADYKKISAIDYKDAGWVRAWSGSNYLKAGFISAYGSSEPDEDFVEMIALYIVYHNATQDCGCQTTDSTKDTDNDGFDDTLYNDWKTRVLAEDPERRGKIWEEELKKGDEKSHPNDIYTGKEKLEQKLKIIRQYLTSQWNIDIDNLRNEIRSRYADLPNKDFTKLNN